MTLDLAERLLRFQESGRRPAQRHLGVALATDAMGHPTHRAVRILDDVGARQAAHQRGRELQPIDGKVSSNPSSKLAAASAYSVLSQAACCFSFAIPSFSGSL